MWDPLCWFWVVLATLFPAPCAWAVDRSRGSRWSARSAARTNDLAADEDPPQTWPTGTRQRRCGSSHLRLPLDGRCSRISVDSWQVSVGDDGGHLGSRQCHRSHVEASTMVRLPHEQVHRHTADFVRHLAGLALDRRTTSCGRDGVDQAARRSRGLDSPKRAAISADSRAAARGGSRLLAD
jgi:hypothetical protein